MTQKKKILIDQEVLAEAVILFVSVEGFVPTAIRSDVMRFREKIQRMLHEVE